MTGNKYNECTNVMLPDYPNLLGNKTEREEH